MPRKRESGAGWGRQQGGDGGASGPRRRHGGAYGAGSGGGGGGSGMEQERTEEAGVAGRRKIPGFYYDEASDAYFAVPFRTL